MPFVRRPAPAELDALSTGTAIERLGIVFTDVGDDFLRATMPVDARTVQPYGLLHGGASVLLAETLGSTAGNLCVPEGQRVVEVHFLAPIGTADTAGRRRIADLARERIVAAMQAA